MVESLEPALAPASGSELISVALIEDNRLVREGLTALLSQVRDLVVLEPEGSRDRELAPPTHPQVVLLDLGLSNGDALREVARVRSCHPSARIVVMDLVPVHEDLVEFVHAGVSGFIMKDATLDDLVSCIRLVARGVDVLPTPLIGSLFSQIARQALAVGRVAAMDAVRMTPRERQVVDLIAEGLANKEIAARLHLATHTVKSHVRNVMEKLALHTRLQIAAFVHRDDPR